MVFCWRADDGPIKQYLDPLSPHQLKERRYQIWTPYDKTLWRLHAVICSWLEHVMKDLVIAVA